MASIFYVISILFGSHIEYHSGKKHFGEKSQNFDFFLEIWLFGEDNIMSQLVKKV